MFSGIIQEVGTVTRIHSTPEKTTFTISGKYAISDAQMSSSVLVHGICSTVTQRGDWITVDYMPETFRLTTIGSWTEGSQVNLESSLRVGDEISGHFVFGHVDGIGIVKQIVQDHDEVIITCAAPAAFGNYLAHKGSICIDGVSLTIAGTDGDSFSVALIPHTLEKTTLSDLRIGDQVNLEADMLAKYIVHFLEHSSAINH